MGAEISLEDSHFRDVILQELVGPKTIPIDDVFWQQSFSEVNFSLADFDPGEFERLYDYHSAVLVSNLRHSRSLRNMIFVAIATLQNLPDDPTPEEMAPVTNMLVLLRLFLAYVLYRLPYDERQLALAHAFDAAGIEHELLTEMGQSKLEFGVGNG